MSGWSQAYILKTTDMKNIFKSLTAFVFGMALFASCQNEMDPLAQAVTVDKTEVELAGQSAEAQKVMVKADGAWVAMVGADWLVVDPMSGNGDTEVKISAKDNIDTYNELNGPRSAQVSFLYGTSGIASVKVNQLGEPGLDTSKSYVLVENTSDVSAGSCLLVFNVDGALKALGATAATETRYEYISVAEVSAKENVIVRPNASDAYVLETTEGGYYISNRGNYLFQDGNGFLASSDKSKAHVWTVAIGEDGLATITNISFGNRTIQLSKQYGTAGAYATYSEETSLKPYLYKDMAAATDEVLKVEETVNVALEATSVSIPVTSNKTWKVRNHDEWIKTFTKSGTGNGTIEVTFDALPAGSEARTATFTVIGETTNLTVVLSQKQLIVEATVEQFIAAKVGTDLYKLTGKVANIQMDKSDPTKYNAYGNFDLVDATGSVLVYGLTATPQSNNDKSFISLGIKEGDIITIVGTRADFKGTAQVGGPAYYVEHTSYTEVTIADFLTKQKDGARYMLTGTVSNIAKDKNDATKDSPYGNFDLTDETGTVYVYGLTVAPVAKNDQSFPKLDISEGDKITIIGTYDEYKGAKQVGGPAYFFKKHEVAAE